MIQQRGLVGIVEPGDRPRGVYVDHGPPVHAGEGHAAEELTLLQDFRDQGQPAGPNLTTATGEVSRHRRNSLGRDRFAAARVMRPSFGEGNTDHCKIACIDPLVNHQDF